MELGEAQLGVPDELDGLGCEYERGCPFSWPGLAGTEVREHGERAEGERARGREEATGTAKRHNNGELTACLYWRRPSVDGQHVTRPPY